MANNIVSKIFKQSFSDKDIKQVYNQIINSIHEETGEAEDKIQKEINGLEFSEDLQKKIISEFEKAEKSLKGKSFKISKELFKDIFDLSGVEENVEEELNSIVNKFSGKVKALQELKDSIGNDSIFINIDENNLDTLIDKQKKLIELREEYSKATTKGKKNKLEKDIEDAEINYNSDLIKELNKISEKNPELNNEISKIYKNVADNLNKVIEKYNLEPKKIEEKLKELNNLTLTYDPSTKSKNQKRDIKDFIGYYETAKKKGIEISKEISQNYNDLMEIKEFSNWANEIKNNFDIIEIEAKETGNGIGNGFAGTNEEVKELINSIKELIDKLKELSESKSSEGILSQGKIEELETKFSTIASNFGDDLFDSINDFTETLDALDNRDWDFSNLKQSLLDIVTEFKNSLASVNLSNTQLDESYKMLKGWNDADTYSIKGGKTSLSERGSFLNSKNGNASNSYFIDAEKSFSLQLYNALEELSVGLDGEISSVYDTFVHSHPLKTSFETAIGTATKKLKVVGSDIGFSYGDLDIAVNEFLKKKISNMMVTNNYKYANLDLSGINEDIAKKLLEEFKNNLLKKGLIFEEGKIKFPRELAIDGGVFNATKKSEIINGALIDSLKGVGLEESRLKTGNIEDLKVDLSQLEKQSDESKNSFKELLEVLKNISEVLSEINTKGFKFNNSNPKEFVEDINSNKELEQKTGQVKDNLELGEADKSKESLKIETQLNIDENAWIEQINNTLSAIKERINSIDVDINIDSKNFENEEDVTNFTTAIKTKIESIIKEEQQMRSSAGKEVASVKAITDAIKELSELISKVPALNINAEELQKILNNSASYEALINSQSDTGITLAAPITALSDEWKQALEIAQHYNSELSDIANVTKQIRTNSKGERLISYKVTDNDGKSITVGKNGNLISSTDKLSTAASDAKEKEKQTQKLAEAQEKHLKEVAEAQRKYDEQLLAEKQKREAEYTSWWEKELNTREQIQQKRDKESYDQQVQKQKESYNELIKLIKEYNDVEKKNFSNEQNEIINEDYLDEAEEKLKRINKLKRELTEKWSFDIENDNEIKKLEQSLKSYKTQKLAEAQKKESDKPVSYGTNAENLNRVNGLYDELLATMQELKRLSTTDFNLLSDDEVEQSVKLAQKLAEIESEINEELTKEYKKTDAIKEVIESIVKLREKGVENIDFNEKTFDGRQANVAISFEEAEKINNALNRTNAEFDELSHKDIDNFERPFERANKKLEALNNELKSGKIDIAKYNEEAGKLKTQLNNIVAVLGDSSNIKDGQDAIDKYLNSISNNNYKTINTKVDNKGIITTTAEFVDQNKQLQRIKVSYNDITKEVSNFGKVGKENAGKFSKFLDELNRKFLDLAKYLISFVGFYEFANMIKQGIGYIVEFDSAMTELMKVSQEAESVLKDFGKESYNIAQQVGSTGAQITQAAADWEKLGYNIKEASELAKNSAIYVNVGDGIDIGTATGDIVSAMKAFDIQAEDSISIIDKYNEVSNNFAISSSGIGEALARSSASLEMAGNTIDQSIAMATAMNEILQDESTVGKSLPKYLVINI